MLEPLGFSSVEEHLYQLLVTHGPLSLDGVIAAGDVKPDASQQALEMLLSKGLIRQLAGPEHEFVAAPPEHAVEVLIAEQMSALHGVRAGVAELVSRSRRVAGDLDATELIEVVAGEGAIRQMFLQMLRGARTEFVGFDRPPYAVDPAESLTGALPRVSRSGVTTRTVYDRMLLDDPMHVRRIIQDVEAGEQVRVATVPLKLIIVDRERAMLPLVHADAQTPEAAVIVRKSVMLDSLIALFETVWENSVECRISSEAGLTLGGTSETDLRTIAHLLALGMSDVAIGRHLEISVRTVRRRIKDLMDELRVDSRLLLGVRLAQRGWV